jgi:hypothetical protein
MWLVLLEYAKDRFLGVEPSKQLVLLCVWYGMTCLLIRDAIRSVFCLIVWGNGIVFSLGSTWCMRGLCVGNKPLRAIESRIRR